MASVLGGTVGLGFREEGELHLGLPRDLAVGRGDVRGNRKAVLRGGWDWA